MKTLEQIKQRGSNAFDGRDFSRLVKFIPEEQFPDFGLEINEEWKGKHIAKEFTREAVLEQLERDVEFGFEKALGKRGLSAGLMYEVVAMWNWVLEEGLENFQDYAQYGLPLFKATAVKYGFENPIGDDEGNEYKYSESADWD